MNLYAVFLPPRAAQALEQAVFVRQGFSLAAFALTPFWALWRSLWLAFGLWIIWALFVALSARFLSLDPVVALALYATGALAFGLEADEFEQARLGRQGFAFDRLALGSSRDEAEGLYYGTRPELAAAAPQRNATRIAVAATADFGGGSDLLGLFPQGDPKDQGENQL